ASSAARGPSTWSRPLQPAAEVATGGPCRGGLRSNRVTPSHRNRGGGGVGVRFSTEDVRDDVRFEYWLDRHRGALDTDLRLLSGRHPHFRASCEIHALGPAEVAVLSYAGSPVPTAGEARRTARDTGRPDGYEIKIPLAAEEFVVSQGDRQARLDPGDFAIVDTARPSSAIVGSRSAKRVVSLILPRVALPVPPARVADVVAVPF